MHFGVLDSPFAERDEDTEEHGLYEVSGSAFVAQVPQTVEADAWPVARHLFPTWGLPAGFYSEPLRHDGPRNASGAAPVPPRPPRKLSPCEASCNGDMMCLMKCQQR